MEKNVYISEAGEYLLMQTVPIYLFDKYYCTSFLKLGKRHAKEKFGKM
jgi:hypothetical protein